MANTQSNDLYRLTKKDIGSASSVLARAFQNNPPMKWQIPDDSKRVQKLTNLFKVKLCTGLKYGKICATSEKLEGLAMWLPPENLEVSLWKFIKCGGLKLLFNFGMGALKRVMHVQEFEEQLRKRSIEPPYWYLSSFGVDPEYQGKGYGSKTLRPMFNRIDELDLPIYLETAVEKNVSMYQHFEFEVAEKGNVPDTSLTIWALIRKKKSSR